MQFIQSKCKICGGSAVAQFHDDAVQEAVDKWLPMLTCNRCYDIRSRGVAASDAILNACRMLVYEGKNVSEKTKANIRKSLNVYTAEYADAMAAHFRLNEVMWQSQWVDDFMNAPEKGANILYKYRNELRKYAYTLKAANAPQVTAPPQTPSNEEALVI